MLLLNINLLELDGFEVYLHLTKVGQRPPVIFTASVESLRDRARSCGIELNQSNLMLKPLESIKLRSTVADCLKRSCGVEII